MWNIHARAARIAALQEQGRSWEEIDHLLGLVGDADPQKMRLDWERILIQDFDIQDFDIVTAARSILEDEGDARTTS